jgi:hypothetical protein
MACIEGVTRAQRAAVMPGEPFFIELFVPLIVDRGACGIYPHRTGTYMDPLALSRALEWTNTLRDRCSHISGL